MIRPVLRHVLAIAAVLSVAAGVVSAQAPAGTGAPPAEQPAQPDGEPPAARPEDLSTPKPAGVGSAQAPATGEVPAAGQEQNDDPAVTIDTTPIASSRPFVGLFGGAAPTRDVRGQRLDLSASVFAAHAAGDTVDTRSAGTDVVRNGSYDYGGVSTSLDYSYSWTSASVGADGTFGTAYLPAYADDGRDPWENRWSAGANAGFNRELSRSLRAAGAAQIHYFPFYQQNLLFQAAVPSVGAPLGTPGLDFVLARSPSIQTELTTAVDYSVSRRGSLEGYYMLSRRNFTSDVAGPFPDHRDQVVGGRYVHRLNRWMGARAGYGYRTATLGAQDDRPLHSHELDAGIDGGRSIALGRRTTFSFNTGSNVFVDQRTEAQVTASRTRWFLTGGANLSHTWADSWSADLGTTRTVDYEIGFDRPLLSNQLYAGVGGLLTRRVDVRLTASYAAGSVGFGNGSNGFDTATASGSIRWAIARNLAAYGQYFYYRYSFDAGVALPSFLQRGLDRQGVSVGLTTWFPVIAPRGRR